MKLLDGLFDSVFPDRWEGVGGLGRVFLTAIESKPNQSGWSAASTKPERSRSKPRPQPQQHEQGGPRPHSYWPGDPRDRR
jgi:hypothetical protein